MSRAEDPAAWGTWTKSELTAAVTHNKVTVTPLPSSVFLYTLHLFLCTQPLLSTL